MDTSPQLFLCDLWCYCQESPIQNHNHSIQGEEQAVTNSFGEKFQSWISLALICFEGQTALGRNCEVLNLRNFPQELHRRKAEAQLIALVHAASLYLAPRLYCPKV